MIKMNALRAILTGSTFKYNNGFFVDNEQITITNNNGTIDYYDIINFAVNTSKHTIIDRLSCNVCQCRTFEPMYEYDNVYIHFSCFDIVKKIIANQPLYNVKLLFQGDVEKEMTLSVYGQISNYFIVSDGHDIDRWCIGYGRPCDYHDFHTMLGTPKLSNIMNHYKEKEWSVGEGECSMCFEEGDVYAINNSDEVYDEACIHFVSKIQDGLIIKYMLFNELLIKDINKQIIVKLVDIYESILD
jgi:hypothetical protein